MPTPVAPQITVPTPAQSTPSIVVSALGDRLTVQGAGTIPVDRVDIRAYGELATDIAPGAETPGLNNANGQIVENNNDRGFRIVVTGFKHGQKGRFNVRYRGTNGDLSAKTLLADGLFQMSADAGEAKGIAVSTTVDGSTQTTRIRGQYQGKGSLSGVEVQATNPSGDLFYWKADSTATGSGKVTVNGGTSFDVAYGGLELPLGRTSRVRVRPVNELGVPQQWSAWVNHVPSLGSASAETVHSWPRDADFKTNSKQPRLMIATGVPGIVAGSSSTPATMTKARGQVATDDTFTKMLWDTGDVLCMDTTLTGAHLAAATTLTVASTTNCGPGDRILLPDTGSGAEVAVVRQVTSGTSLRTQQPLAYAHAAAAAVGTVGKRLAWGQVPAVTPSQEYLSWGSDNVWRDQFQAPGDGAMRAWSAARPLILTALPASPVISLVNADGTLTPLVPDVAVVAPTTTPIFDVSFPDDDLGVYYEQPGGFDLDIRDNASVLLESRESLAYVCQVLLDVQPGDGAAAFPRDIPVSGVANAVVGRLLAIGYGAGRELRTLVSTDSPGSQPFGSAIVVDSGLTNAHRLGEMVVETPESAQVYDGPNPTYEKLGERTDRLISATGWVADANAAVAAYSATSPTGYALASSLEVQATGAVSTTRGARKTPAVPLDLSVFSGGALIKILRRVTSVTNLTRWALRFEFATTTDWAQYELVPSGAAINTWAEVTVAKNAPQSISGTVDWSNVTAIRIVVIASAAYTGNLEARDLRIGLIQTDKTVPDGNPAPEATIRVRARWKDINLSGTYGAWSDGGSRVLLKLSLPPTLAAGAAPDVTDPTPGVAYVYTSPGGKGQAYNRLELVRTSDGALLYDSGKVASVAASGATVTPVVPADILSHNVQYQAGVQAWDTDGLASAELTIGPWTTAIMVPAAITGLVATPDTATSKVALTWTQSLQAATRFARYTISRSVAGGAFEVIGTVTDKATPSYTDEEAPINVALTYRLTQTSGAVGQESPPTDIAATVAVATWFVVTPGNAAYTFGLPHVVPPNSSSEPLRSTVSDIIDATLPIVATGPPLARRGSFRVQVARTNRALIDLLEATAKLNVAYVVLKSALGRTNRVRFVNAVVVEEVGTGMAMVSIEWIRVA